MAARQPNQPNQGFRGLMGQVGQAFAQVFSPQKTTSSPNKKSTSEIAFNGKEQSRPHPSLSSVSVAEFFECCEVNDVDMLIGFMLEDETLKDAVDGDDGLTPLHVAAGFGAVRGVAENALH
jgi:hypothetical protein